MPKIKRRHENALLAKAVKVFSGTRYIYTGQELTRKELRKLERLGVVDKQLMSTDKGAYLYRWGMVRMPQLQGPVE